MRANSPGGRVVTHVGAPQIRTKEESLEHADDLPEPEELGTDAIAELEGAVEELNAVLAFWKTAKRSRMVLGG
jgi:hypothetical protein